MVARKEWMPFEEAREFVRGLGLKTGKEWSAYLNSGNAPSNIPSNPDRTYKDQWVSTGDWLGTGNVHKMRRVYRSFEEARKYVRGLRIGGQKAWKDYVRVFGIPSDVPSNPNLVYKDDWDGWGDWLGTFNVSNRYRTCLTFEEAREHARSLKLQTAKEWREYARSEKNALRICACPDRVYRREFSGYRDWLGYDRIPCNNKQFLPFDKARDFVRALGLKGARDWREYCKTERPDSIPSRPDSVYKDEYLGLADWIGHDNREVREFYRDDSRRRLKSFLARNPHAFYPSVTSEEEVVALMRQAKLKSKESGIMHCLDHIDPIKHSLVCGLHVATNLQIITALENNKKYNKFIPYGIDKDGNRYELNL